MNKFQKELQVGKEYKSYKKLCEALGEKVGAGNTKKAQMKEWECHFSYEKQGNKFIITEIFEEAKQKLDGRGTPIVYIDLIERLILEMLNESTDSTVTISKSMILRELKMVNSDYSKYKYNRKELCELLNISKEEVADFYHSSDSMLNRNIESALERLKNKSIVDVSEVMFLAKGNVSGRINEAGEITASLVDVVNEYGDIKEKFEAESNVVINHKLATDEEIEIVLTTINDLLAKLGARTIADIYKRNLSDDFYRVLKHKLWQADNIKSYYHKYKIVFTAVGVKRELEYLEANEKRELQMKLNEGVQDKIYGNMEVKHNKNNSSGKEFRNVESYLTNGKNLVNKLIKEA